jgi:hypothetical protein
MEVCGVGKLRHTANVDEDVPLATISLQVHNNTALAHRLPVCYITGILSLSYEMELKSFRYPTAHEQITTEFIKTLTAA